MLRIKRVGVMFVYLSNQCLVSILDSIWVCVETLLFNKVVYPPIHTSTHPPIHPSIQSTHPFSHPSTYISIHPFVARVSSTACTSNKKSIHPSVCPSVYPHTHPAYLHGELRNSTGEVFLYQSLPRVLFTLDTKQLV